MAFENVRPFLLDTRQFDNALSGLAQTAKQYAQDQSTAEAAGLVAKGDRNALMGWAQRNPSNPLAVQYTNALAKDVLNPPKADPMADIRRKQAEMNLQKTQAEIDRMKQGPRPAAPRYMVVNGRLVRMDDSGPTDVTPQSAVKPEKPDPLDTFYGKERARADFRTVNDYRKSADGANELRGNLDALKRARSQTNTEGPIMGLLPAITSAQQAVDSAAENVRLGFVNKTKGAVSDAEMNIFGMATPGRRMRDDAANTIIEGMDLAAQREQEQAIFFDEWMRAKGNLDGAQAAWQGYANNNPIIQETEPGTYVLRKENVGNWRQYFSGQGGQAAPTTQTQQRAPQGNAPAAPQSQQEYQVLPSGTRYVDPNGVVRVKP